MVEKIRTIGGAYMVAGRLGDGVANHSEAIADLALDMLGLADHLPEPHRRPRSFVSVFTPVLRSRA